MTMCKVIKTSAEVILEIRSQNASYHGDLQSNGDENEEMTITKVTNSNFTRHWEICKETNNQDDKMLTISKVTPITFDCTRRYAQK